MAYDKDGNYIPTIQDKANEKSKKDRKLFVQRMEKFLKANGISGTAYTYGFSTTNPAIAQSKLKKLGVKFKIDKSPNYHTKVIISSTEI